MILPEPPLSVGIIIVCSTSDQFLNLIHEVCTVIHDFHHMKLCKYLYGIPHYTYVCVRDRRQHSIVVWNLVAEAKASFVIHALTHQLEVKEDVILAVRKSLDYLYIMALEEILLEFEPVISLCHMFTP